MEARKDYILDRWVFYSPERKKRPREFKKSIEEKVKVCFFCLGNEKLTPPEIGRIEEKGKWKIRWFPNKFPIVELKDFLKTEKSDFFSSMDSYGKHEVIVETNDHNKQLWDLPGKDIKLILDVYKNRISELNKLRNIKYTIVFKNHGKEGGTSLVHSHTQVVALPLVPTAIKEEVKAINKFKKCPYCRILKMESKSKRKCFENKSFVAFCPYASRFNYEVWVFPKKHVRNITELDDKETNDLAEILRKILVKLKKINAAYNFFLHYSPKKQGLHFHIEVTPRIATWAGFEFSTDFIINSVMPEDAAGFYSK